MSSARKEAINILTMDLADGHTKLQLAKMKAEEAERKAGQLRERVRSIVHGMNALRFALTAVKETPEDE